MWDQSGQLPAELTRRTAAPLFLLSSVLFSLNDSHRETPWRQTALDGARSCLDAFYPIAHEKCGSRAFRLYSRLGACDMTQQHHSDQSAPEDSNSVQRPPASYGQACSGCSKAKCKCVRDLEASGASCQRCRRLGRACQPSRITRKRGGGRPPNRTAQIEEKLESLVTLLRSQGQPAPSTDTTRVEPPTLGFPSTEPNTDASSLNPKGTHTSAASSSTTSGPLYSSSTPSSATSYSHLADIGPLQAEESLQLFRTAYLAAFPLACIPSTTT